MCIAMLQLSDSFCCALLSGAFLLLTADLSDASDRPHIVIILADDLGWNDISFHGSDEFTTPNIDALAYSGVILHDYYSQPICTPARAALLTGRHPIHNGMQHNVIFAPQPWGLPLSERLLPQYLRPLGYVTRGVGKWHLGFYKADYTPTRRGFDSFYGSWLGHQDHFTHMAYERHPGYDLHRDLNVSWEGYGKYAADLFTEEAESVIHSHDASKPLFLFLSHTAPHSPLQAPRNLVKTFKNIDSYRRRKYAAMVTKVDESVGRVTQALQERHMLNNSIVLFLSDNGGATDGYNGNVASNWPLRGSKDTLWEGGVRSVGLIWSPLLKATPRIHRGLVNVQDWVPTLLEAAGSRDSIGGNKLDGVSQWSALNNLTEPPYQTMLHNYDSKRRIGALRDGRWKIVRGRTYRGRYDGWYGRLEAKQEYDLESVRESPAARALESTSSSLPGSSTMRALRTKATVSCGQKTKRHKTVQVRASRSGRRTMRYWMHIDRSIIFTTKCRPHRAPCLFNVEDDPCELYNVAVTYPHRVRHMMSLLRMEKGVRPNNKHGDHRSYPHHWNHTWTTWHDFL